MIRLYPPRDGNGMGDVSMQDLALSDSQIRRNLKELGYGR